MPEYIEREALKADALRLTGTSEFAFDYCFPYWQFAKCIKEAPAADVVSVVRCKDCRFLGDENLELHDCDHTRGPMRVELDDFCSYGERKCD